MIGFISVDTSGSHGRVIGLTLDALARSWVIDFNLLHVFIVMGDRFRILHRLIVMVDRFHILHRFIVMDVRFHILHGLIVMGVRSTLFIVHYPHVHCHG